MANQAGLRIFICAVSLLSLTWLASGQTMVGYWRLDENGGLTAEDASERGNTGSLVGAGWTAGRLGSALNFDGVNDYVSVAPSNSLDVIAHITIAAWIYPTDINRGEMCIVDKYEVSGFSLGVNYDANINREVCFLLNISGSKTTLRSVRKLENNTWYHVIASYDGAAMKLAINGVEDNSLAVSGAVTTNNVPLLIGAASNQDPAKYIYFFKGKIDEVRLFGAKGKIYVLSPNGGERCVRGATVNLHWYTGGLGGNVKIILVKGIYPALYNYLTISSNTPNSGIFSWKIPESCDLYENYRLYIETLQNAKDYDHSDAVWSIDPTTAVIAMQAEPADEFQLRQNYPNPFNPVTKINFSLSAPAEITLCITNELGQQVKTLLTGSKPAGVYSVPWDGTDDDGRQTSAGVYFYTLQANDEVLMRNMVKLQ
jgi:hypothetical protein